MELFVSKIFVGIVLAAVLVVAGVGRDNRMIKPFQYCCEQQAGWMGFSGVDLMLITSCQLSCFGVELMLIISTCSVYNWSQCSLTFLGLPH